MCQEVYRTDIYVDKCISGDVSKGEQKPLGAVRDSFWVEGPAYLRCSRFPNFLGAVPKYNFGSSLSVLKSEECVR